jgi:sulfoxide reductase heme-binding subunit YedZ
VTTRDPLDYGWWLASRSAGVVAYLLLSAGVVLGLLMATRRAPVAWRGVLRAVHERIAIVALGATLAHGLLLLPDPWLKPGLAGVFVPFASPYRPVATGVGVLSAYLAAGLSLTYYARRRLGAARWRRAHRLIPIAWALAAGHVLTAGTDAGSLWLEVPIAFTIAACLTLLGDRWLERPAPAPEPVAPSPPPAAQAPTSLWARQR